MRLQAIDNKALSQDTREKSAPILAEITIRKSQYKIATVANLINSFDYGGYNFSNYDPNDRWKYYYWIASRTINANMAGEARYKFINELIPLIDEFSLVSQYAFRLVANTYIIYKKNNNDKK